MMDLIGAIDGALMVVLMVRFTVHLVVDFSL